MHIANETWFWWLAPLVGGAVLLALWTLWRDRRDLATLGAHNLVLSPGMAWVRRVLRSLLVLGGLGAAFLGAVRFQGKPVPTDLNLNGVDFMVVLDVSKSMLTQDIPPNRLEAAKKAVLDLLGNRDGDRAGVVVFAGEALVQVPLTMDLEAVQLVLSKADTDAVDRGGTDIGEGIRTALAAFPKDDTSKRGKAILLITDGETTEGASDVTAPCQEAKERGIPIVSVGIGTPQGRPIPDGTSFWGETQFKKDQAGRVHISHLDETTLHKIADLSGGVFVQGDTPEALGSIQGRLDELQKTEMKGKGAVRRQEFAPALGAGSAIALIASFLI
ncbi:MAG TPA: VWA domain-containing protein [bacterium]|nr:VWA domain-containing protein [bacterium]